MSGAVTVYTNDGTGTVSTGGTTAPAGGTVEAWTVNVTIAFPVASTSATPPTQFLCADRVLPAEKFLVTVGPGGTGAAQSWTVTRGAEGTTPVAHTAGFTIDEVTTAGGLGQLARVDWLNAATIFGADSTGAADSTAAIQAALNAASAGQVVYLPAGTYKLTAPLTVPNYVGLCGSARTLGVPTGNYGSGGLNIIGSVLKPASTFTGAAVISLGNAPVAQAGGQYLANFTIDGSSLPASSAVAGIQAVGWIAGVTVQYVTIWSGGGTGQMLGPGLDVRTDGSGHAPDFWDIAHVKVSAINGVGINFSGLADSYVLNCEATGNAGGGWTVTNGGNTRFTGCKGEGAGGSTAGWVLTSSGSFTGLVTLDACTVSANGGVGFQVTGAASGEYAFTGCRAFNDGGSAEWLVNGSFAGIIQLTGCSTQPGSTTPANGLQMSSAGACQVLVSNSVLWGHTVAFATDGTGNVFFDSGCSYVTGTAASPTTTLAASAASEYIPPDLGFVAWAYDPVQVGGLNSVLTSGTIYLIGMQVQTPVRVTGVRIFITVAAAGLTAGQCFVGLYNSAGTKIGASADQSGSWGVTTTVVEAALSGGPFALQPGLYWVAILANGTTPPGVGRVSTENATLSNGRNGVATARFATNGTVQTSLPASITPASNTANSLQFWAAIY